MKKGFTIIELLVASLLLGMLMSILTMIFNQSSISWRIAQTSVMGMDTVRDNMAEIREEADNAFLYGGQLYRITSLWNKNGELRDRACDAPGSEVMNEDGGKYRATLLRSKANLPVRNTRPSDFKQINVGSTRGSRGIDNYTVNVMSAGPDRVFDTWDDIWSWPDDFE